eukprot:CAMPEP_0194283696 /NCGR_PEP_ID=MMETSP0169-20130528/25967_1 /TAXON_ID=218684 /ORGANISM="Corethron pennatum, Strain L29A3" /LENGTH=712 /DNA_ID=CAMNT_0039029361 /DNA_START=218 /DNA_END=2352 /DNA_ORIENTATION=+
MGRSARISSQSARHRPCFRPLLSLATLRAVVAALLLTPSASATLKTSRRRPRTTAFGSSTPSSNLDNCSSLLFSADADGDGVVTIPELPTVVDAFSGGILQMMVFGEYGSYAGMPAGIFSSFTDILSSESYCESLGGLFCKGIVIDEGELERAGLGADYSYAACMTMYEAVSDAVNSDGRSTAEPTDTPTNTPMTQDWEAEPTHGSTATTETAYSSYSAMANLPPMTDSKMGGSPNKEYSFNNISVNPPSMTDIGGSSNKKGYPSNNVIANPPSMIDTEMDGSSNKKYSPINVIVKMVVAALVGFIVALFVGRFRGRPRRSYSTMRHAEGTLGAARTNYRRKTSELSGSWSSPLGPISVGASRNSDTDLHSLASTADGSSGWDSSAEGPSSTNMEIPDMGRDAGPSREMFGIDELTDVSLVDPDTETEASSRFAVAGATVSRHNSSEADHFSAGLSNRRFSAFSRNPRHKEFNATGVLEPVKTAAAGDRAGLVPTVAKFEADGDGKSTNAMSFVVEPVLSDLTDGLSRSPYKFGTSVKIRSRVGSLVRHVVSGEMENANIAKSMGKEEELSNTLRSMQFQNALRELTATQRVGKGDAEPVLSDPTDRLSRSPYTFGTSGEIRSRVGSLVRRVVPGGTANANISKSAGKEEELSKAQQSMQEKQIALRALITTQRVGKAHAQAQVTARAATPPSEGTGWGDATSQKNDRVGWS